MRSVWGEWWWQWCCRQHTHHHRMVSDAAKYFSCLFQFTWFLLTIFLFSSINDVVVIRTRMTKKQYKTKMTTTSLLELGKRQRNTDCDDDSIADVIELRLCQLYRTRYHSWKRSRNETRISTMAMKPGWWDLMKGAWDRSRILLRWRLQHKGGTLHVSKYVKTNRTFDMREYK